MAYALVNGALVKELDAVVSINDRSFRFGDGVFETIFVHGGLPYLWEYHLERLTGGLEALRITCDTRDILPQALALLKANKATDGLLRIQVSRGEGSRGYLPSGSIKPTVVMQTLARPAPHKTATLWLSSYEKISPRMLPTRYKLGHALGSILARMEAAENGCSEALQRGEDGCVCEASSANIFWRKGGMLHTPSLASGALAGVTRRRIIKLSPHPVQEGLYTLDDLKTADAVILTSSASGATAVECLKPQGIRWNSAALADEVNAMIDNDIILYTSHLRESLA